MGSPTSKGVLHHLIRKTLLTRSGSWGRSPLYPRTSMRTIVAGRGMRQPPWRERIAVRRVILVNGSVAMPSIAHCPFDLSAALSLTVRTGHGDAARGPSAEACVPPSGKFKMRVVIDLAEEDAELDFGLGKEVIYICVCTADGNSGPGCWLFAGSCCRLLAPRPCSRT